MKGSAWFFMTMLAVAVSATGCMKLGPDYKTPHLETPIPASYPTAQKTKDPITMEDRWWELFGDRELNRVVEVALDHNLDIRKTVAGILEARSRFIQTHADRFPRLEFEGGAQRQRRTVETAVPAFGGMQTQQTRTTIDSHNLSLPASFELDLWGRLARSDEAARADLLRAQETSRTVAQTVVAETVSLYLQIEALERRIQISERSIRSYRQSLSLVQRRYGRGLASILDVRQAKRLLARAESQLPGLRQDLGIAQQRLAVLMGRYPKTNPARQQPEDYFQRLDPVPAGLPSDLLKRRPDIRAAEANLQALNARIGVAKASRFPRITLTAGFGYSSEDLSRLFQPESELWNIAMGLLQPVFDAGKLKAAQRAAEARYQEGAAEYAKTVLTAFFEVESALLTRKEQLMRRERVLTFLEEARITQEVAESRYARGLVDYLNVLEAMQTRFQAEEDLVLVDLTILSNRVTLHRSLGGGWGDPVNDPIRGAKSVGWRDLVPW